MVVVVVCPSFRSTGVLRVGEVRDAVQVRGDELAAYYNTNDNNHNDNNNDNDDNSNNNNYDYYYANGFL